MTHISTEEVQRLAHLSNIEVTPESSQHLTEQLEAILGYVEQLGELSTENVAPTYQVTDVTDALRDDTLIDYGLDRDALLANAPATEAGQIKVPGVF